MEQIFLFVLTLPIICYGLSIGAGNRPFLGNKGQSGTTNKDNAFYDTKWPWEGINFPTPLQSPVDILTDTAKRYRYKPLQVNAFNDKNMVCTLQNTGHGYSVRLLNENEPCKDKNKPILRSSFLQDDYVFENLHYHWGRDNYFGNEHLINGESFSLEGHLVTYKKEYGNITVAMDRRDGIVVLTFFAVEGRANREFQRSLNALPQIYANGSIELTGSYPLLWFWDDVSKRNDMYYAIFGSLTTMPFKESVTFILLPKPISISANQLETLRGFRDPKNEPVKENNRRVFPLRGRPLIKSEKINWNLQAGPSECEEDNVENNYSYYDSDYPNFNHVHYPE